MLILCKLTDHVSFRNNIWLSLINEKFSSLHNTLLTYKDSSSRDGLLLFFTMRYITRQKPHWLVKAQLLSVVLNFRINCELNLGNKGTEVSWAIWEFIAHTYFHTLKLYVFVHYNLMLCECFSGLDYIYCVCFLHCFSLVLLNSLRQWTSLSASVY